MNYLSLHCFKYTPLVTALLAALSSASWGATPPATAFSACSDLMESRMCNFQSAEGDSQLLNLSAVESSTNRSHRQAQSDSSNTNPDEAYFDATRTTLYLPETDAGALGRYYVTLRLSSFEPLIFELNNDSLRTVTATSTPDAVYNAEAGTLTISVLRSGSDWWSAELQQLAATDALRFEVTRLTASQAPSDGSDNNNDENNAGDVSGGGTADKLTYPIVDTNQTILFDDTTGTFSTLQSGEAFFGQDANYIGNAPSYTDNGDGTITDNVTGLMWQKNPDFNDDGVINVSDKKTLDDAIADAANFNLASYDDWRLPTIKELYSLMDFSGTTGTGSMESSAVPDDAIPYLDAEYFDFAYGDVDGGERYIDAQYWSSTVYVSTTMGGSPTAFGVNFADGRIKGYPYSGGPSNNARYVRYVRGADYGNNIFTDNSDGTISDAATGLMWLQNDSGHFAVGSTNDGSLLWEAALAWCEGLDYAQHTDWRLPNIKELQSILDYNRSPDTTNSAAIDPMFNITLLPNGINSSGVANYPFFWSGTTHVEGGGGSHASYMAFGEARGYMNGELEDVHGAGAQRSDPKSGDPSIYTGVGFGPQNDVISIYNYARCVRGGQATLNTTGSEPNFSSNGGGGSTVEAPQEAIDACNGLSANASCAIQSPQGAGTISGVCTIASSTLVCIPEGGPPSN